jgi:hypothetical protein
VLHRAEEVADVGRRLGKASLTPRKISTNIYLEDLRGLASIFPKANPGGGSNRPVLPG